MIEMTKVRIYFAIKSNVGISSYVLKETKYFSPLQLVPKILTNIGLNAQSNINIGENYRKFNWVFFF